MIRCAMLLFLPPKPKRTAKKRYLDGTDKMIGVEVAGLGMGAGADALHAFRRIVSDFAKGNRTPLREFPVHPDGDMHSDDPEQTPF